MVLNSDDPVKNREMNCSDQYRERTEGAHGGMHLGRMVCSKCSQRTPFEHIRWDDIHKCFVCRNCQEL